MKDYHFKWFMSSKCLHIQSSLLLGEDVGRMTGYIFLVCMSVTHVVRLEEVRHFFFYFYIILFFLDVNMNIR